MRKLAALVPVLALAFSPVALAESLIIQAVQADAATADQRPARGMTMQQVSAKFGAPESKVDAVGTPPISRWQYAGYTVYFEKDRVLHAVVRR